MDWKLSMEKALQEAVWPSVQQLKSAIEALNISVEKVSGAIANPGSLPYGRTLLYHTPDTEAVLVHLPQGRETYIHDHGFSIGCAKVLEGTIANRIFRVDAYGYPVYAGETILEPGSFYSSPKGQIHQLRNVGFGRAVSFHLYAPALSGVKNYYPYEQVLDFVI
ncbi:cysteine dioxygenase [Paenibacillus allorhizosphaerae]|uniref:Cysteine dioxygenase n=1 Tax=Paenibacillus allorhizosphaerae TaxID=2849866 RepID=A0ABM8VKY0_9BACL|nr:cysteine dioxygenase family protein [Paenibacillus allorhizosphaerae]CAG7647550.1 Cysteine dioxygenase [Paenibacillus allorhizosphaerae]